ncbi:MAG: hypothetical protein ACTSQE_02205 [Candidatus Heimdallarchaeaceae archaeon]
MLYEVYEGKVAVNSETKYYYDPTTNEFISLKELLIKGLVEEDVKVKQKRAELIEKINQLHWTLRFKENKK